MHVIVSHSVLAPLLFFALSVCAVQTSVDDTDPQVTYSNVHDWTVHSNQPNNWTLWNNTDTFSSVKGAWLTFTFDGAGIEYWGNQGSAHGPCIVNLDDLPPETVSSNLATNGPPKLLFSNETLGDDRNHTIKVTVASSSAPNTCELDRFIYTPHPPKNSSSSLNIRNIAIGGAIVVVFLLFAGCCAVARRRSRRRDVPAIVGKYDVRPPQSPGQRPLTSTSPHGSPYVPLMTLAEQDPYANIPAQYIPTPYRLPPPDVEHHDNRQTFNSRTVLTPPNEPHTTYDQPHVYPPAPIPSHSRAPSSEALLSPYAPPSPQPSSSSSQPRNLPLPSDRDTKVQPVEGQVPASRPLYQHEDAGRIPVADEEGAGLDELPPAYKDDWSGR